MKYFDLHCDTLCVCSQKQKPLYNNGLHVDLAYANLFETYIQCTAAFVHDEWENPFQTAINSFKEIGNTPVIKSNNDLVQSQRNGGAYFLPTIENSISLEGKIENIQKFADIGVKVMSFTWNADNQLGGGIMGQNNGITEFGVKALEEMERLSIVPDLSHASEKLFYDVASKTNKPLIATHSNAKTLCKHPRNLTDEQIKEIINRNGLIGINFFKAFLTDNGENCTTDSIIKHIDYFLSLGAKNVLAMGSDFDGCSLPEDMLGLKSIPDLYEKMLKLNYKQKLVDKIFFENAYNFFENAFTL
ncbi:MAG: membrane dipeptidase [Clostridia bacterium]